MRERTAFPLYDGHGNPSLPLGTGMVATLSRSAGFSYTLSNQRGYDVWGAVRQGSALYCSYGWSIS